MVLWFPSDAKGMSERRGVGIGGLGGEHSMACWRIPLLCGFTNEFASKESQLDARPSEYCANRSTGEFAGNSPLIPSLMLQCIVG
jgi:hypothetical protein